MRATLRRLAGSTSYGRLFHSAQAFAANPGGASAWQVGNALVGVIGKDKVINSFIRYGANLSLQAGALDEASAKEMVALMRERAPRLTGLLHDGIEAYPFGGAWAVEATAQKYETSADYARMVEFGTAPGERGRRVASDDYFAGPFAGRRGSFNEQTGRRRRAADARRKAARTHPGTPAQPYFVPSVQEVMARRGVNLAGLSDSIAAAEDLM